MSRGTARRAFDDMERRLVPLALRHPGPALAGAAALGRLRNRVSRQWPHPEQVRSLFPGLGPRAAAGVAWAIGGTEARNRLLVECLRRGGLGPVRRLVRTPPAFAALRPPLILGTFHVGAVHAFGPALERLSGPVLGLRLGPLYAAEPPVEIETTAGDGQRRALSFQRALARLESGGFVVTALDVVPGAGLPTCCLGRSLELARGPFALSRLAGAAIVPLAARWRGGGVEVEVGEPLTPCPDPGREADPAVRESALAAAAARWLERYLLASPAEIGLGLLRTLLAPGISPGLGG